MHAEAAASEGEPIGTWLRARSAVWPDPRLPCDKRVRSWVSRGPRPVVLDSWIASRANLVGRLRAQILPGESGQKASPEYQAASPTYRVAPNSPLPDALLQVRA